jgi:hypothetical protein
VFVVFRARVRLGTTDRDFQVGYAVMRSTGIPLPDTLVYVFVVPRYRNFIRIMLNLERPFSASPVFNQKRLLREWH